MTPFNPDSWMDVFALAFLGLCSVAGLVVPAVFVHLRQGKSIGRIEEQVANSHHTNLRDDIDDLVAAVHQAISDVKDVKTDVRDVKHDIGGLREELRTERVERIDGDRRRALL